MKPEKARGVENLVLQMAQRGQITEKVSPAPRASAVSSVATAVRTTQQSRINIRCPSPHRGGLLQAFLRSASINNSNVSLVLLLQVSEERLIGLLEQIGQQAAGKGQTKVTMQRRRTAWDDDD